MTDTRLNAITELARDPAITDSILRSWVLEFASELRLLKEELARLSIPDRPAFLRKIMD